ncbi:MAG: aminopeptidase P family protein [Gemmatimonadetes bacterium]|nr:MAG: aminopeptidase P family protein [Gemmatimonadota bacterium]
MKPNLPDKEFFIHNREQFIKALPDVAGKRMAVFFSNPTVVRNGDVPHMYRQESTFLYLTGIEFPHSVLILYPDGDRIKEMLFIEQQDPRRVEWEGKALDKEEAQAISGIEQVEFVSSFPSRVAAFAGAANVVWVNAKPHALNEPPNRELSLINQIRERFPFLTFQNAKPILTQLRLQKSAPELERMRKAIQITGDSMQEAIQAVEAGMYEYQFQALLEYNYRKRGSERNAFGTIVGAGKNATILHYEHNRTQFGEQDLVLVDSGAEYGYYAADITRCFPVSGRFTDRQRAVYQAVLDVQKQLIEMIKPGLKYKTFDEAYQKLITAAAKDLGLKPPENKHTGSPTPEKKTPPEEDPELVEAQQYRTYWKHGIGHSLGLDVHDVSLPRDEWVFSAGNVLTVEPGLYLEEEGIGVRIEDDILITETGYENLSQMIPKEIDDIEALFKA